MQIEYLGGNLLTAADMLNAATTTANAILDCTRLTRFVADFGRHCFYAAATVLRNL
jgi:hypothetical protein